MGWRDREAAHHERVDALLADHLARGRRGERHPVEDFLFTYYSFRPGQLRRWHPGAGVVLRGFGDADAAAERAAWTGYTAVDGGVAVDVPAFLDRRGEALRHVRALLAATAGRAPHLGCFGLHEWAMVYRRAADDVRHAGLPLRLGPAATDAVVESHRIRCSHVDAFRFFTDEARPLNTLQPERGTQVALEQPGCLHATMDLYKWAYKLVPAVPSELVADCFELARDVRRLDMQASPYDVSELGLEPVPVERPDGKAAYVEQQRAFADRAAALRDRLLTVCDDVLGVPVSEADPRSSQPTSVVLSG